MSVNQLVPILTADGVQSSMSLESIADAIKMEFNTLYQQIMAASDPDFDLADIATITMANNGTGIYGFLGDVPAIKDWVGSKTYGQMKKYDYKIENVEKYTGLAFGKKELRQSGLINLPIRVRQMVEAIMFDKKEALVEALINGDTNKAYDGVAFFSNASGLRTNDNLLAGTGVTLAQISADIISVKTAAGKFESDEGRKLRIRPMTVVCPLALEDKFLQIKESTTDASQSNSAVVKGAGKYIDKVIADPLLDEDDANDWYMLDTRKAVKPIILQGELMNNGQDVETVEDVTKWASDGILGVSVEASYATGYGHPATAVKVVNG
jgi:phage major head subunit gpT-like protein